MTVNVRFIHWCMPHKVLFHMWGQFFDRFHEIEWHQTNKRNSETHLAIWSHLVETCCKVSSRCESLFSRHALYAMVIASSRLIRVGKKKYLWTSWHFYSISSCCGSRRETPDIRRWRQLITVQFSAVSWRLGKAGGFSVFFLPLWLQYYLACFSSLPVVASAPRPPWPCLTAERRVYRRSEHHLSTVFAWSTFSDLSFSATFGGQLCKPAMSTHTVGGWLLWLVLRYEMWHALLGCRLHYLYARLLDVKQRFGDVPLTKSESNENGEKMMCQINVRNKASYCFGVSINNVFL